MGFPFYLKMHLRFRFFSIFEDVRGRALVALSAAQRGAARGRCRGERSRCGGLARPGDLAEDGGHGGGLKSVGNPMIFHIFLGMNMI